MTSMADAVRAASAARDWRDSVAAIHRQHGSGAARYLAGRAGVSDTTARRWINGTQAPNAKVAGRLDAIADAADEGALIADALANAHMIDCGQVEVFYNGKSQGYRTIGTLTVDAIMRGELEEVGALWMAGAVAEAQQALSDALLGGYSRERTGDSRNILAGTLNIGDFRTGFRIT